MSEVKKEKKSKADTKKKEVAKETKTVKKKADTVDAKETKTVRKKATIEEPKKEIKLKEDKVVPEKSKKEDGLLNQNDQNRFKVLSKIIKILAKIGRIFMMILIPFIVLAMILIPIVFKKVEINANVIKFGDASIVIRDTGLSFKLGDKVQIFDCTTDEIDRITTYLSEHSKESIVLICELSLFLLAVVVVLDIYILMYIEKLFSNFEKKKTPFTKENTNYIFSIAKYLVIVKAITICVSMFGLFAGELGVVSIIEILIIFTLYYIFKYATGVQKLVDTKVYD